MSYRNTFIFHPLFPLQLNQYYHYTDEMLETGTSQYANSSTEACCNTWQMHIDEWPRNRTWDDTFL